MKIAKYRLIGTLIFMIMLILAGCATVPKEVVELSYIIGQDLNAIHSSYRELIQNHFEGLRTQTNDFLDNRWIPAYIEDFIQSGELVVMAQGADPKRVLEDVQDWADVAISEIADKKRELIDPIDNDEKEVLNSVNEAFIQLIHANATITAHLNSIREIKDAQDEALEAMKLKDLVEKINGMLSTASKKAEEAIEAMK